ncbi:multicopper oxidase family protein [Ornithinibacillus gellani]|nr:multicopper oxidase family protein [Ornithinibacillus gellani]
MEVFIIYYTNDQWKGGKKVQGLQPYVDPLPRLQTIQPTRTDKYNDFYEVRMKEFRQKVHRDLPPTRLWGYHGLFPGPLFDVPRGRPIQVKWINDLPDQHFLPIDQTVHDTGSLPEVRTVTHLHGGKTKADSDGYPEAWYTKHFREVGPFFEREIYEYPNDQRAAALWYHDHAMGITRLNVYAGLVGMYLIRDQHEKRLNLPAGDYEIPLILMDRSFHKDGRLAYPSQPDDPEPHWPNPSIRPFFLGDVNVVNGKIWPYLEVEPRKYRFRLLNASNTRAYTIYLDSDQPFYQIGSDGGLLKRTHATNSISLEPAERIDLILDFTHYANQTIHLKNDLGPDASPDDRTTEIMQFRVKNSKQHADTSSLPNTLSHIPSLSNQPVQTLRNLKLNGTVDDIGRPLFLLDGKGWMEPVTETPTAGSTEIWSLMNVTDFTHPIHIHLIQFQVLDRRPFDLARYNKDGSIVYTGSPVPPAPNERGWKDTVAAHSGEITRVIATFEPYTGDYVWHCHILEHEDYDMMRPLKIIAPETDKNK